MATMYPNYCWTDSPGEKKLFKLLRDSSKTTDWVILHSLHISRHISKTKGEADFVVLIPSLGILVIEIKSHQQISVRQGSWFFGKDNVPHESPFKQADTAMYSIRNSLLDSNSIYSRIPFLNLCWFTELDFPKQNQMEYHNWQVLNITDLDSPADAILKSMNSGIEHLKSKLGVANVSGARFDGEMLEKTITLLRPNYDFALSEKLIRSERRSELLRFAEEQFVALDTARDNPRVIFKGAAGTGKSVLAVELAKRKVADNLRVGLICFNRLLADELSAQLQSTNTKVTTFDSLALRIAKARNQNLPTNNIDALNNLDIKQLLFEESEQVDVLIIDEAQDIFNEASFVFLDRYLKNGLKEGNWYAFGDFESQKIYNDTDSIQLIFDRCGFVTQFPLTRNCRNVIQIGHFVEGVLKNVPRWNSFLRSDAHPDPILVSVQEGQDIVPILDRTIYECRQNGFVFDDITILSPLEIPQPSAIFFESEFANKFISGQPGKTGKINFVSIGRFKGLESPCVVLIDLEQLKSRKDRRDLLYVALTRATDRLVILANTTAKDLLVRAFEEGV